MPMVTAFNIQHKAGEMEMMKVLYMVLYCFCYIDCQIFSMGMSCRLRLLPL